MRFLIKDGQLVRIGGDLIVSRTALETLKQEMLDSEWLEFSVAEFKDRYGLSRKWAIPLLEYLDQQRITQRVGNARKILRPR